MGCGDRNPDGRCDRDGIGESSIRGAGPAGRDLAAPLERLGEVVRGGLAGRAVCKASGSGCWGDGVASCAEDCAIVGGRCCWADVGCCSSPPEYCWAGVGGWRGAPDNGEFFLTEAERPRDDGLEPDPVCETVLMGLDWSVWPKDAGLTRLDTGVGRDAVNKPTDGVLPDEVRERESGLEDGICDTPRY